VQLYYQIGVMGQRDLPFTPDPRSGLEMVLLRMVAFRPAGAAESRSSAPAAAPAPKAVTPPEPRTATPETSTATPMARSAATPTDKWGDVVAQLGLAGLVRELANNTTLESSADGAMVLVLEESHAKLLNREREAELKAALEKYYGGSLRLTLRVGRPAEETPAKEKIRLQDERQQAAVQAIAEDPNVRALQEKFNARVNPASIRPKI